MSKWILGVGCSVVVALIVLLATPFVWRLLFLTPNRPFNGRCLNAVVEQVKARGVHPEERVELRLDNLDDPRSLRARRPDDNLRGREAGNVWATREATGTLIVIVMTSDNGHAGRAGYAYSEAPPREYDGALWVGEYEYLNRTDSRHRVADKWWEVWSGYGD